MTTFFSQEAINNILARIFVQRIGEETVEQKRHKVYEAVAQCMAGGAGSYLHVFQLRVDDGSLVDHKFTRVDRNCWIWSDVGVEQHPVHHYGIVTHHQNTFTTAELIQHIIEIPVNFSQ
jgi:hypothetical protein